MTSRISQPDTEADLELRACLDERPVSNFVMVAGAGSGKTTSLVKALNHLAKTRGLDLRRRGHQIACITYTEIAVEEIWGDVGNAPLFHVSTIHSFLWSVVKPFNSDIRDWVNQRIESKIIEANEKIEKPRTRPATRERLAADIARYRAQQETLNTVTNFTYGTGSDYANGILGHDDILKIGPTLITEKPLLRNLIAGRFPFVFVDESQDTEPSFVEALKLIANTVGEHICLGFFGDAMQKIYLSGTGPIELEEGWRQITKSENFRCPLSILGVINRIRAEDDGLEQIRGRMIEEDGVPTAVEGTAKIFVLTADERRSERLAEVREWLRDANDDPHWASNDDQADVRVLVLVHRMAAFRLGFSEIYAALNDHGPSSLKNGLLDGTAWVLRPFLTFLLPLVISARSGADFSVISALRSHSPLLHQDRVTGQDAAAVLTQMKTDVAQLMEMFADGSDASIRQVLSYVRDQELMTLDDRFIGFLGNVAEEADIDSLNNHDKAARVFLNCPATQLWGYQTYIEDQSPFATQQGIKGAEFQRVLAVLDDEEGNYNLFSYGKYFGLTPLSAKDQQNIDEGKDSVVDRTRRLFYVCCSRAIQDLAVAWFVADVNEAKNALLEKGFFLEESIHVFND